MSDSGPRKIGVSIEVKPHAYDPIANPELFEGVLARRCLAFVIDVIIIAIPVVFAAVFIFIVGLVTLGLGWVLYWLLSPASVIWAICYYGLTFVLGAVHAIAYWFTVSFLTPLILLVAFFNQRGRLLHDMLVGTIVINNRNRAEALRRTLRQ
jgi:uncharacterized RDD family membrane protein YckC